MTSFVYHHFRASYISMFCIFCVFVEVFSAFNLKEDFTHSLRIQITLTEINCQH